MPRRKGDDGRGPGVSKSRRGARRAQAVAEAEAVMTERARSEAEAARSQVHDIMGRLTGDVGFDVDSLRRHGVTMGDAAVAWGCFTATIVKYAEDQTVEPDKVLTALGQSTRIACKLAEASGAGLKVDEIKVTYDADAVMPAAPPPPSAEAPAWERSETTGDEIQLH